MAAAMTLKTQPDPAAALMGNVGFLLSRTALRLRDQVDEALAPLQLTGKLLWVLKLVESEGAHTQQELGLLGCIDRSSAVTFLDSLEALQLVRREDKPGDRRAHVVALTDKGRKLLPKALALESKVQQRFLESLDERDHQAFISILGRLVRAQRKEKA